MSLFFLIWKVLPIYSNQVTHYLQTSASAFSYFWLKGDHPSLIFHLTIFNKSWNWNLDLSDMTNHSQMYTIFDQLTLECCVTLSLINVYRRMDLFKRRVQIIIHYFDFHLVEPIFLHISLSLNKIYVINLFFFTIAKIFICIFFRVQTSFALYQIFIWIFLIVFLFIILNAPWFNGTKIHS